MIGILPMQWMHQGSPTLLRNARLQRKKEGIDQDQNDMNRPLRITIVTRHKSSSQSRRPQIDLKKKKFTLDKRFNFNDLLGSASAFITIYNYLQLPYN